MTEDSATLSLDLANEFPEAEEIQTRNNEPPPKTFRKRTGSPNPPKLRKFTRLSN